MTVAARANRNFQVRTPGPGRVAGALAVQVCILRRRAESSEVVNLNSGSAIMIVRVGPRTGLSLPGQGPGLSGQGPDQPGDRKGRDVLVKGKAPSHQSVLELGRGLGLGHCARREAEPRSVGVIARRVRKFSLSLRVNTTYLFYHVSLATQPKTTDKPTRREPRQLEASRNPVSGVHHHR